MPSDRKALTHRLFGTEPMVNTHYSPAHDLLFHIFSSRMMIAAKCERSPVSLKTFMIPSAEGGKQVNPSLGGKKDNEPSVSELQQRTRPKKPPGRDGTLRASCPHSPVVEKWREQRDVDRGVAKHMGDQSKHGCWKRGGGAELIPWHCKGILTY